MNPHRHLRIRLLVALVMVTGSLVGSPTAVGADDGTIGGVTRVTELGPDESIGSFGPYGSTGATAMVFGSSGAIATMQIFTGERSDLAVPAGFESARSISEDGSVLIAQSQSEALGGDDDGGLHDIYLHDLSGATTTSVTSSIAGASHALVASSNDASTVIFRSVAVADTADSRTWAWRSGVVTELSSLPLSTSVFDFHDGRLRVSGDGSVVAGTRSVGPTQIAYHLDLDTDVLTERIMRSPTDVGPVSRDGETVVWLEFGETSEDFRSDTDLVVWRPSTDSIVRHRLPDAAYEGPLVLSGDGSRAFLTRYSDPEYFQRSVVMVETGDGSTHEIVRSEGPEEAYTQLLAADQAGTKLAFLSYSDSIDINGQYEYVQALNVWDETGDPSPSTASPVLNDQIERLYRAYFGRAPDAAGLAYWIGRRVDGSTLADISQAFASSPEFSTTYGALDDGAFVDLVYANVLGRSPDPEGRAFWVGRLAAGTNRGAVMVGFSESVEFATTTGTSSPMSVREAGLRRLYRAFFLDAPSEAEVDDWLTQLDAGVPLSSVAGAFAQSPDFAEIRNAESPPLVLDFVVRTRFGEQASGTAYETLGPWIERTFDGTFELVPFMMVIADHPDFVRRTGLPLN